MLTNIFRNLIYAVFTIMLLQSCERDIETYPQTEETAVAKKWYEDNGKPFPLDWSKSQLIKIDNKNTTLIVPLENGTNLGPDNSMQQNLVFTIEGNKVAGANKVNIFADTRTVAEFSDHAISNFVKKQVHRSEDLGKVYYMIYNLDDILVYSQSLDSSGLKNVNLQLKTKDADTNANKENGKPDTSKNIPVVCSEWYLVEYFDDGTAYWTYLYTTCSGTATGGGGGGGGGSHGGGSGAPASTYYEAPTEPIDIQEILNCFSNIPSNAQTTYKVTIHSHLANPSNPYQVYNVSADDPGHAYITMQKTNGSATRSLTFGFYPSAGSWMTAIKDAENSAIGQEDPAKRRNDGSYTITVTEAAFNNARNAALAGSAKQYDLNDYNCTNYALQVFNAAMGGTGLQVPNSPIGYKTPSSLYLKLSDMKTAGTAGVSLSQGFAPTSTTPCN
ncbi:hypothetical protein [Chryseobacterium sp. AG363]|uniref:hypothetical protein n=1 Tax=Chryseobacterium sp. AG363 TaxID=2183997 RepID=UPI000FF34A23|nr:hypothetical protein [Chryseobacterium sp. AG363]RKE80823.1 hypothetical protein DEU39_0338 [Chryseobacterium sp. AG363]